MLNISVSRPYTCSRKIKTGSRACETPSLPAAEIEQAVVDQVRVVAEDEELRAEVLRQAVEQSDGEVNGLRKEQGDLKRELARHHAEIRQLALEGTDSAATTSRIADLHTRVTRVERRLAELRKLIEESERSRLDKQDVDAAFSDFDNIWNALSPKEQAEVLSLLVERVEFDSDADTLAVSFHPTGIGALAQMEEVT